MTKNTASVYSMIKKQRNHIFIGKITGRKYSGEQAGRRERERERER
jgi:hypothetical protein